MARPDNWREYWGRQVLPLHRIDGDAFYRRHAAELSAIIGDLAPASALELGCGNGAMHEFLGLDRIDYTGVDFSDSMLNKFRERHPEAKLEVGDASRYRTDKRYDLILSESVIQYLDREQLDRCFANVRTMMHPGSLFLGGTIPWSAMKWWYFAGASAEPYDVSVARALRRMLSGLAGRPDPIGHWYSFRDISALARKHGMTAQFYGSAMYPWRFHAAMQLQT